MRRGNRQWFWATLVLSSISIVTFVFAIWELIQNHFFQALDYRTLHFLYLSRGIVSSLLLATWAVWYVLRERRFHEEELRRSHERYRGILEGSPDAVVLYDDQLVVVEWNLSAERLFGFKKSAVVGQILPTIPEEQRVEALKWVAKLMHQDRLLDLETLRWNSMGEPIWVSVSLTSFRDEVSGRVHVLEVARDIREKIALRDKMMEVERLATVGQMAAGIAHHLNTPLAAMLLRVQMLQENLERELATTDLAHLETGIRSCQNFVQRLLYFSRRIPDQKKPEEISQLIESVVNFLRPRFTVKRAKLNMRLDGAQGRKILANRGQLEALFSAILVNGADAISEGGNIEITAYPVPNGHNSWPELTSQKVAQPDDRLLEIESAPFATESLEIRIEDDGPGISEGDMARLFEPFFTTKPPGQGTGLGLPLARTIAQEHGGALTIRNRYSPKNADAPSLGRGACVVLRLPLCS